MKIVVISDTHGQTDLAEKIISEIKNIDLCIHLGDYYKDALYISEKMGIEIVAIKGNCDSKDDVQEESVLKIEGHKIFITHGHEYNVKTDLNRLYYKAKSLDCHIALFGHTHKAIKVEHEGMIILNPGSLTKPRGTGPTYAVLEINKENIEVEIIEV
ncbi:metallophosphoesterase [Lutibacter sp. B2]|nr:metallophosphoesterase [Lutibacter sp. B2]